MAVVQQRLCRPTRSPLCVMNFYSVNHQKTHQNVLLCRTWNPAHLNKIWRVLSSVNSPYSDVNVFHLTWIMSLVSSVICETQSLHFISEQRLSELWMEKNTKVICRIKELLFHILLLLYSIVDINTGVILKPQHFQCVKNFKFKAKYSRRLCHLPEKHECYVLQASVETLFRWGGKRLIRLWQI